MAFTPVELLGNLLYEVFCHLVPGVIVGIVGLLDLGGYELAEDRGPLPAAARQLGNVPIDVEGVVPAVVRVGHLLT